MTKDIIAKLFEVKLEPKVVRKATGKVYGNEVTLILEEDTRYSLHWWVRVQGHFGPACFATRFFANRYFNELVKKYKLKEVT